MDSLDGVLESNYDQSKSLWANKSELVTNNKTIQAGRSLKIRTEENEISKVNYEKRNLFKYNKKRLSSPKCCQLRNDSESSHNSATNSGFSRKVDGGFYNY